MAQLDFVQMFNILCYLVRLFIIIIIITFPDFCNYFKSEIHVGVFFFFLNETPKQDPAGLNVPVLEEQTELSHYFAPIDN